MAITKVLLTAEDLFDLPHDGRRYELVKGELQEMAPPGGPHGTIQFGIGHLFAKYIEDRNLDFLVGVESGVILQRAPDTVRGPDVYVIDGSRLNKPELPEGYLSFVPDIVVEVISPGDRAGEIQERIQLWLDAGVRLLVIVYPRTRSVTAYRGHADVRTYRGDDDFDTEPVLPGFRCPVSQLFKTSLTAGRRGR